ncbi:SCP2 sterol-binding domain-containing protein [Candidatus Bipolaricaulota bacterium]|nr:SCP2 sterol-binding domain-containing protein [Candidatus Bipolaricaulota bacterium]MCK5586762.1 SCP2 sterol-binding domain-containing protein [Candidatus Bipolaricaulota bacterium]
MSYRFPSDEWIKELSRLLNESDSYESSAKDWEGDFVFEIQPDKTFEDTAYLFLGLLHGKSPEAALLASPDERDAAYHVIAPYGTWRKLIDGTLDPIQGMMMRKLKLQGNVMKIMRYPKAAQEILSCCTLVPTQWPED